MNIILTDSTNLVVDKVSETINERNIATLRIHITNYQEDITTLKILFTNENCKNITIISTYEVEGGVTTTENTVTDYKFQMLSKSYEDRTITISLTKEIA